MTSPLIQSINTKLIDTQCTCKLVYVKYPSQDNFLQSWFKTIMVPRGKLNEYEYVSKNDNCVVNYSMKIVFLHKYVE